MFLKKKNRYFIHYHCYLELCDLFCWFSRLFFMLHTPREELFLHSWGYRAGSHMIYGRQEMWRLTVTVRMQWLSRWILRATDYSLGESSWVINVSFFFPIMSIYYAFSWGRCEHVHLVIWPLKVTFWDISAIQTFKYIDWS